MKSFLIIAVSVLLLPDVSGWWLWGKKHPHNENRHHSVTHVSSTFTNTNTNCDCNPYNFTGGIFSRALDANGDGEVNEREAASVLDNIDGAPSLEDLQKQLELEERHIKTYSKSKTNGCCVSTVHHSVIDNNDDGKVSKGEAARMLNMEEDHPGLQLFMHHADKKRDGMVDVQEFRDAVNDLEF